MSADWGPELSVFWTDRHFSLGRFLCSIASTISIIGACCMSVCSRDGPGCNRSRVTWLTRHLRNGPTSVRRFATAESLEPKDRKAYVRALLPCAILLRLDDWPDGLER